MRLIITLLAFFISVTCFAQENIETAKWLTSFEEAKAQAKSENKNILINFSGSDWCLPCAQLERDLFSTEAFFSFSNKNLVLLKADFPVRKKNQLSEVQKQHNNELAEIYNKKGTFPVIVIVNDIGKIKSYINTQQSSTEAYLSELKKVTSQSIN